MNKQFLTLVTLGALAGFAQAQTTTDPVGFITLPVAGGGSLSQPKLSLIAPTLLQSVLWQGTITGISGNTFTVSGTPWTANQFNGVNGVHFAEIVSTATPANSGALSDINTTTTNSITTSAIDGLGSFASVGDTIRIRKHVTIGDLFGVTNSAGLLASDDPSTADEVLIYVNASSVAYFYYTGSPGYPAGWYDSAFGLSPGQAAAVPIGPNDAVVIKRKASAPLTITFSGTVKTGNTLIPIVNNINVLPTVSAKGMTLAMSGLYTGSPTTGVKPSDDPSTADEVTIYSGTSSTSYFYFTGFPGYPAGWYDSAFSLAPGAGDLVSIPPGASFVVKRKGGGAFNWPLPSPSSF